MIQFVGDVPGTLTCLPTHALGADVALGATRAGALTPAMLLPDAKCEVGSCMLRGSTPLVSCSRHVVPRTDAVHDDTRRGDEGRNDTVCFTATDTLG
eukprot:415103-Rhodomonas_salina.2